MTEPGLGAPPKGGWAKLAPELAVSDLEASLAFWRDAIGSQVAYWRPAERFAYLERDGARLAVLRGPARGLVPGRRSRSRAPAVLRPGPRRLPADDLSGARDAADARIDSVAAMLAHSYCGRVMTTPEGARTAPAAARNREPILAVLRQFLPARGTVVEVASGSGEHAIWFAAALPQLTWQPTDHDPHSLRSIEAWRAQANLANLLAPLALDAARPDAWPITRADAVLCINMIHIAPWRAAQGLIEGAARVLPAGARLILYGPFREGGQHTAPSNESFDRSLRAQDPQWGVRDLDEVDALAAQHGFARAARVAMPANNLSVVFEKR